MLSNTATPPVFVFKNLTNADDETLDSYGEDLQIQTPAKFTAANAAGSFKLVSREQVSAAASFAGSEMKRIFGAEDSHQ